MVNRRGGRVPEEAEMFAFEEDAAFQAALAVAEAADRVAMEVRRERPWVADQLGRASVSVVNNTAEAWGEYAPKEKARFYRYAIRSAHETAAMVVFLAGRGILHRPAEVHLRRTLLSLINRLTRRAIHLSRSPTRR